MRILVVAICVVLATAGSARAENWPQWRGPSANGISSETNLPVQWSATENITWKLPLPTWSGSTPIIWGEHIFLNVAENGSLFLWAVDRTKGEPLWKRHLGDGDHRERKQNMSTPSPVTDGTPRLGDDRHRHPERRSTSRQGAVDARHPEGIRALWPQLGLRIVADALRAIRCTCRCCTG